MLYCDKHDEVTKLIVCTMDVTRFYVWNSWLILKM